MISDRYNSLPIAPEALEQMLLDHAAYISDINKGRKADLRFCDLTSARLSHRVLSNAAVAGAILEGADLSYADCVGTDFTCADLRRIDGRFCNFSHACLQGVLLSDSNLNRAKFDYVDLGYGRLTSSCGKHVRVRSGSASRADLGRSSLFGSSFSGADLQGTNFRGAIIHATRFRGAQLAGADFTGAVLSHIDLEELNLPQTMLSTCVLAPPMADAAASRPKLLALLKAHHQWVESEGRAGGNAILDYQDLRPLGRHLGGFRLSAISARGVMGVAVNFGGLQLQGANFEGADLRGAHFDGADLRGVRFRGAKLSHASFRNAVIGSLTLKSGEYLDFDIFRAEIQESQLADTIQAKKAI